MSLQNRAISSRGTVAATRRPVEMECGYGQAACRRATGVALPVAWEKRGAGGPIKPPIPAGSSPLHHRSVEMTSLLPAPMSGGRAPVRRAPMPRHRPSRLRNVNAGSVQRNSASQNTRYRLPPIKPPCHPKCRRVTGRAPNSTPCGKCFDFKQPFQARRASFTPHLAPGKTREPVDAGMEAGRDAGWRRTAPIGAGLVIKIPARPAQSPPWRLCGNVTRPFACE